MDLYNNFLQLIALIYSFAATLIVILIPVLMIVGLIALFFKSTRRMLFGKKPKKA